MVSSSKNEEEQIENLNSNFQNEKNKLLKLRNYIENNLNLLRKILVEGLEKFIMIKKKSYLWLNYSRRKR